MLDRFQRTTVEAVREHHGIINIILDDPKHAVVSTAFPDERLSKDIAIALQGYYTRINDKL